MTEPEDEIEEDEDFLGIHRDFPGSQIRTLRTYEWERDDEGW